MESVRNERHEIKLNQMKTNHIRNHLDQMKKRVLKNKKKEKDPESKH